MSNPNYFTEHEIKDNIILTNKKPDEFNRPTILIGAEKVAVGYKTDVDVIKVDPVTGLNYKTKRIDTQQVYNVFTQKHSNWFALDLETGQRGWYPGAKLVGIVGVNAEIKEEPNIESTTLETVSDITIDILDDNFYDSVGVKWYYVSYNDIKGYIRSSNISTVKYIDSI